MVLELLTFERPTRSSTDSSATQKLKKRECDSLLQKIATHVLVNCAVIEQLTFVWCVKAQYVESVAANNACHVCGKALKACLFH